MSLRSYHYVEKQKASIAIPLIDLPYIHCTAKLFKAMAGGCKAHIVGVLPGIAVFVVVVVVMI